jgi:hypothetical protein
MYREVRADLVEEVSRHLHAAVDARVVERLARFAADTGSVFGDLAPALRAARSLANEPVLEALVGSGQATDAEIGAVIELRDPYRHGDLYAAIAVCDRFGETAPLAEALRRRAAQPAFALQRLLPVAHRFDAHVGLLRSFVGTDEKPPTPAQVLAAHALLRTGDPGPAEAVVRAALRSDWTRADAARLAIDLHDTRLKPDLRAALAGRRDGIYAAVAIVALGASPDEFVSAYYRWLRPTWTVEPNEIRRLSRSLASPALAQLIDQLAAADARVIRGGEVGLTIWEDEFAQRTLRDLSSFASA